jgi:lysophospholipase L1-like esterase
MGRMRALSLVLTVATFGLLGGPAWAKSKPAGKPPVVRGSQYLALGDSVTFGYMESGVTPPPNYKDAASFLGYPEQLSAALHLSVANAACPGETSSSLINANGPSLACENDPQGNAAHYRFNFPLHVNYKGSQLAYALSYLHSHHRVRLVSLMIGANDYFRCQETTADGCTSASELAAVTATVSKNVHTILSAIRNRAHYHGQLVIVHYYSLNYSSVIGDAQSKVLNGAEDAGARPFHAEIADGYGEFALGSAKAGGSPCTAGLLTQLGGGRCGIHPSYAGQALLAQAVEKAIKLG